MTRALWRTTLVAVTAAAIYATPLAAQEVKMEGIIVTHQHGQLTIKTPSGNQTIALAPNVRVRSIAGALGGQKQVMPPSALIPGLPIVVEGTHAPDSHFVAHEVDYKGRRIIKSRRRSTPASRKRLAGKPSCAMPIRRWANGMFFRRRTYSSRPAARRFQPRASNS